MHMNRVFLTIDDATLERIDQFIGQRCLTRSSGVRLILNEFFLKQEQKHVC